MVWSAGLAQTTFVSECGFPSSDTGSRGLLVDDFLRVPGQKGRVFALGDCAVIQSNPLPPIATAAEQSGLYLADCFNLHYKDFDPSQSARASPLLYSY